MRILIFHPVHLPARHYGGTERVVIWLARALAEIGHEVYVAALEGSQLPSAIRSVLIPAEQTALGLASRLFPANLDVVHLMAPASQEEIDGLDAPYVMTIHGNGKSGEKFFENTVFLSQDHARRHHSSCFVYNGLDPQEYRFNSQSRSGAYLFLSKTSWRVKNLAGAMKRCRRAKVPLWIAGGERPWLLRAVAHWTPGMEWLGSVGGDQKADVLSRARALLFPVLWNEPFGLVVVEALLSGTPVIAHSRGSMVELINDRVGALLEDSDEAWIELLKRSDLPWKPLDCRQWAEEKFHYHRMARDYVELYQKVMQGESLNAVSPYADS